VSSSNTKSPGLRPTSIANGILMHPAIWPQWKWAENWGMCRLFGEGELGPHLGQFGLGRGPLPCQVPSWSLQPFGHNRHGPKTGSSAHFWGGELDPHLTQCRFGRGLPTKWHLDPSSHLATTDMGQKLRGLCPFGEGELGPHLTHCGQRRGLPVCQVSSWSIQPFSHNTPALQTGQTTVW